MNTNRLKLLLVSLLAVFAVSAVASGSASANGQCYKTITAGLGTFADSSCVVPSGSDEYIKVAKLETELTKPSEWCAKVTTEKTGNFTTGACTTEKAKEEFIKVHVPTFWVCRKGEIGKEPPIKYDTHLCNTKEKPLAEREWSWLPVEKAEVYAFEGTSGVSKLESTLAGLRVLIECKKDKITGELESGGRTKNAVITYEECSLFEVTKYVKVALPKCKIPTIKTNKLNDYLIAGKGAGPEDEFEPAEGTTFAEITIEGEGCALNSKTAVTGKQICQLPEAPVGQVEHEIECSPSGGSLKLGANAASYFGNALVKLTNGWSWGAEP
jgi:hypothetical protein